MTLLDELTTRLLGSAKTNGWPAREAPELVSHQFRGREGEADVALPKHARGLKLGFYPVIAAELRLAPEEALEADLKAAHNQMIIARSFLLSSEVVDAHIFFVTPEPSEETDWKQRIDHIERDQTVSRKLVWMPAAGALDASFDAFVQRTFLARPWIDAAQRSDAPLDQNEQLVETVLQEKGLSAKAAAAWVRLAKEQPDDPEQLIEQLVSELELRP